ncbi:helix-turn-helix domain-containing protein [Pectobacteriaceae bacterium CE70]|uniref:Transcriptional regulator n=1 Tax=Serratia sp. (strain ATCC 39006) TaxID=104623 RepID=A0A2I5TC99_SERS3|nr:helix-turn-helix domain-containing protein [Serratia sp. ATCC 39006]WJV63222.1 helix-turn-helix domain-containing protein [Pectobacteriaceae bacterium C52]WJV67591.1 helix-turn-helix domain-containing protein [Pectobacteriaceae bacterium CE70]WJY11532.1 helix-turn-helix domain-containing protein [Pectobacteriaceae bacterium C80]AUH02173.1 transcriptional regulator [Serratia sp. ATCC 39006]AUH06494.1 transcriptional regulator [Serratia sp. ATCC 39006]
MSEFNVYSKNCPARFVLDRLSNKWALLILDRLADEPVRFNQLRRDVEGISQKVLSQTLKNLERDGLIHRQAFATVPVTVEYSITSLGQTLVKTINELTHWAENNIEVIMQSQQRYDEANVTASLD